MRALIVEDSKQMRNVAKNMLRQLRRFDTIDEAEDGEDGWEQIRKANTEIPYSLVLCDVRMDGLGGIGLLKRCRSHGEFRHLPFLMISGSSEEATIAATLGEWQANDFIVKPFSLDTLLTRIDVLLKRVQDPEEMLYRQVERLKESGSIQDAIRLIENAETEGRLALAKWVNIKGECLLMTGDAHGAAEAFEKAASICKIYVAAYKNCAIAHNRLGNNEKAIEALKSAEEISPTDDERSLQLGRLQLQAGQSEEGAKVLHALVKRSKGSERAAALKKVGQVFLEGGLFGEVEKVYSALLDHDASDLETYNRLGMVLRQQNKYEEALQCYKRALKNHPDNAALYHNMGVLFASKADYKTAQSCFQKALSLDPRLKDAKAKLEEMIRVNRASGSDS